MNGFKMFPTHKLDEETKSYVVDLELEDKINQLLLDNPNVEVTHVVLGSGIMAVFYKVI